jgi:thiol peroxidase
MTEREGVITLKGNPVTLIGNEVQVGAAAPELGLRKDPGTTISLSDYAGKTVVLVVVPSVDTPVCDTEIRKFNEYAKSLDAEIVVASVDLPMAQGRWCGAAGIENVVTASDYYDHSFGVAWGVRIKEIGLLARAVYVIDGEGIVRYAEVVPEVAEEPNYDAVIEVIKSLK